MQTTKYQLNDPRIINGWALFDWANSAFALVITTAIFPGYFLQQTDKLIDVGPILLENGSVFSYATSAAYFLIAIFSPLLSGIADYGGKRKFFLRFFTTLGSIACISLFFFKGMDQVWIGIIGYILAMIGFAGGLVFYNSYLPDIATEDQYDRVSARGFAFGYIGSMILLIFNLAIILSPETFGIPAEGTFKARIAFLLVGIWWFGFAQIAFKRLPADTNKKIESDVIGKGMEELKKVWKKIKIQSDIKTFLIAFFCISAGAQTVLYLAAIFGTQELNFEPTELIIVVLIIQFIGIIGAYLFAILSEKKGNINALITIALVFVIICFLAYFVQEKWQFYVVAGLVGLVMGGVQSLSRSTYSKFIPNESEDTTSYFSFYDVLEKIAIVSGTVFFGVINQLTGNMRNSVVALSFFFLLSVYFFWSVKIKSRREEITV